MYAGEAYRTVIGSAIADAGMVGVDVLVVVDEVVFVGDICGCRQDPFLYKYCWRCLSLSHMLVYMNVVLGFNASAK